MRLTCDGRGGGVDTETQIVSVRAREILDSRGNPTIEVDVGLRGGATGRGAAPSGASKGSHEAVEIRDGVRSRFKGRGVLSAVDAVNSILAGALFGVDALDQETVDATMVRVDGTRRKEKLGANSLIAVSIAVARAAASATDRSLFEHMGGTGAVTLPVPMMNVLNGGVHANWQGADFQEYMIVPYGASSFSESLRWGAEIYQTLKDALRRRDLATCVGDEGGFAPAVKSNEEPFQFILGAIEEAGFQPGKDIGVAIDPAATGFYSDGKYQLRTEMRKLNSEEMIDMYHRLADKYPLIVLEDGLAEDDWEGWRSLTATLGSRLEIVGDDLFVTNIERIRRGLRENAANAVLIKPNQIGTISETKEAVRFAVGNGWGAMMSHRSGETMDTFIADFTVAMGTGHLKTGAPCRGERVEKYNQLLRIQEQLGERARFAGRRAFIR